LRKIHPLAGTFPNPADIISRSVLKRDYFGPQGELKPVKNGTSGHRGVTGQGFSEAHVAAMTQALVDIRSKGDTRRPMREVKPAEARTMRLAAILGAPLLLMLFGFARLQMRKRRSEQLQKG